MPNHVTNELTAAAHVLDSLAGPDSAVDFNTVIPMPEILRTASGNSSPLVNEWAQIALGVVNLTTLQQPTPDPIAALERGDYGAAAERVRQNNLIRAMSGGPFPKDFTDEDFTEFLRAIRAIRETGHADWYSWCSERWGTKWNAYSIERRRPDCVYFQTAWSPPGPVLDALSRKFPAEEVRLRWADEDFGCNTGDVRVRNGELIAGGRHENQTPVAYALALELIYGGVAPEDMVLQPDGRLVEREEE